MAGATKKRDARKSLRQPGWITLDGGFAARQCVVQDMSTSGAMITVDDPNVLPGRLRLGSRATPGRDGTAPWSGAAASRSASSSSGSLNLAHAVKRRDAKHPACDHSRDVTGHDRHGRADSRSKAPRLQPGSFR